MAVDDVARRALKKMRSEARKAQTRILTLEGQMIALEAAYAGLMAIWRDWQGPHP